MPFMCAPDSAQTADSSHQSDLNSASEIPKWTPADERALLAKAQRGDVEAQMWLGIAYEQGRFGKTNYSRALTWLKRAAESGKPDGQVVLGQMHQDGGDVRPNYPLAAKWYRKAAEHVPDLGAAGQGRNNLPLLYLDGHGVPKDYVQAYL